MKRTSTKKIVFIVVAAVLLLAAAIWFAVSHRGGGEGGGTTAPERSAAATASPSPAPEGTQSAAQTTPSETAPAQTTPVESDPAEAPDAVTSATTKRLNRSAYTVELDLYPAERRLAGRLSVNYLNSSQDTLYEVKFRLYPNDVAPGSLSIAVAAVDSEAVPYTLSGDSGSILTVPLPLELKSGESAALYLEFSVDIPETGGRYGVNSTGLMLGNALPIACKYENGAWRTDAYESQGDPFYSDAADYEVVITYPQRYLLAHTGSSLGGEQAEPGRMRVYVRAPLAREFALALMPGSFKEATADASGSATRVHAYADTFTRARAGADIAKAAIDFFDENIGDYPYSDIYVVPFDGSGGMEYPGLVMINTDYFRPTYRASGELVIGHEIAHQWFYGVVGSDQSLSPWLDEALVEFLGTRFAAHLNGEEAAAALEVERYAGYGEGEYIRTHRLDASITELGEEYFAVVYAYGRTVFDELYEMLGRDAFYLALTTYYNANSYSIASKEAMVAAFSDAAGYDLAPWFEQKLAVPGGGSGA